MMLKRIAASAVCALLLASPASAQVIGSGHVMGNGTGSAAVAIDNPLVNIMNQSGSGITFAGSTRNLATVSGVIANGHCRSTDANGNDIDAGGTCTVGGGGGTVSPATIPASPLPAPIAIYTGSPGSSTTVAGVNTLPLGNGGSPCDTLEAHSGGTSASGAANVTAYAAVISAAPTNGGCLRFGPGTYNFNANATGTFPNRLFSLDVGGAGKDATTLNWTAAGGLPFALTNSSNSFHVHDLALVPGAAGGATCISATFSGTLTSNNPYSDIERVACRTGSGTYWDNDISDSGVVGINVRAADLYGDGTHGVGLLCQGSSNTNVSSLINVSDINIWNLGIGIELGSYCQSLFASHFNIIGGVIGIFSPSSAAGTLTNFQFGGPGSNISLNSSFGILLQPLILDVQIQGLFIDVLANQAAISITSAQFGNIIGNDLACQSLTGTIGVNFGASSSNFPVTGNTIRGCGVAVEAASGASNIGVQSNIYSGNSQKTSPTTTTGTVVIGGGSS